MSSKYLDREGNKKVRYLYPPWVTEGRTPPEAIRKELEVVRRNPRAFKERKNGNGAVPYNG